MYYRRQTLGDPKIPFPEAPWEVDGNSPLSSITTHFKFV